MLKYCMRMQGVGFLVAVVVCGFGLQYFMTHYEQTQQDQESFAGKTAHKLDGDRLQNLINFIDQARIKCDIPGVAIGIVQNGHVVLEQGFGVRNIETQEKVTPETLFMLGSVTKSLTTCMMAKLIDEGFFNWDTPVTELLPSFAVNDAIVTQQLTIRDMVSHRTGIAIHKNIFTDALHTPEIQIAEMRYIKPTAQLRQVYQYSNEMVAAAGYIAAHRVYQNLDFNQAYQKVMQKYLFDIVGMQNSLFNLHQDLPENHSSAYSRDLQYQNTLIDENPILYQCLLPAGGAAWSNIQDMNKYLLFELANGINTQGERVISEKNLLERREPQIKTSEAEYGLGYRIGKNKGILTLSHGGATFGGFSSYMFLLPEHSIGCIIVTNINVGFSMQSFIHPVHQKILEILFDGKPEAQKMLESSLDASKEGFQKFVKNLDLHPSQSKLLQYVGTYNNPKSGTFEIHSTKTGIEIDTNVWKSNLVIERKIDANIKLMIAEGPFAGTTLSPQENNGNTDLMIKNGQQKQLFTKTK